MATQRAEEVVASMGPDQIPESSCGVGNANVLRERLKFHQMFQRKSELFDAYVVRLKHQLVNCQYGQYQDIALCDQLIFGMAVEKSKSVLLA
jgi:hypothetical protein